MTEERQVPAGTLLDDKYRVVRLLGRGAMGAVYEVENVKVRRSAALKLLPASASADIVRRFEAEAQAAGRAGSKRIVDVLDLGRTANGQAYMVMELLEGETLRDELKRARRLTPKRATTLLVDVLIGLEAAHAAGIVHRDLKPENIWVLAEPPEPRSITGETPVVKILDFGVSRFTVREEGGPARPRTAAGTMIGTCWYMSPEQIRDARDADARADVYAIGVMLYELVSGNVPFPGGTLPELLFKIMEEPAEDPRLRMPAFPEKLASIALRALAKKPEDRFSSAADLREHLVAYLEDRPALHLDLGPLEMPRASGGGPAHDQAPAPPPSLDIALDVPDLVTRPSTLETWRATLDSRPQHPPHAPTLAEASPATPRRPPPETAPFPLTKQIEVVSPPSGPSAAVPTSAVHPGPAAPPSSPRFQPPPDLVAPSSGPQPPSSNEPPISLELAALPRRVDLTPVDTGWPRAPIVVGVVSLAVLAFSTVLGLLFRADVFG